MTAKKRIGSGLLVAAVFISVAQWANGQFREAPRPEVRGVVKAVDAKAGTITVSVGEGREATTDKTVALGKNGEIVVVAGSSGRGPLFREVKLGDLSAGVRVSIGLSADQKTADSIVAEGPVVRGIVKAVDAKKNTLTIGTPPQREQPGEEKTYAVSAEAEVAVDDGRGKRFSIKEAALGDLAQGALVTAWLSIDGKQVQAVLAEGPLLFGTIKTIDPAKKTLTLLVRPPRGDDPGEEHNLTVSKDAMVLLDDGRGRRLSLKQVKLADVPAGSAASVKLAMDHVLVMQLRAEGPSLTGLLKSVDPAKGVITIGIPKGRDDFDEKTLTVAKDARVAIDGSESKLGDLKVQGNGPFVHLRLSLDQKTVQVIMARQTER